MKMMNIRTNIYGLSGFADSTYFSNCKFFPVSQGGESGYFPELPYKVGDIVIPADIANIRDGMVFIHQQPAGLTYPYFVQKPHEGFV